MWNHRLWSDSTNGAVSIRFISLTLKRELSVHPRRRIMLIPLKKVQRGTSDIRVWPNVFVSLSHCSSLSFISVYIITLWPLLHSSAWVHTMFSAFFCPSSICFSFHFDLEPMGKIDCGAGGRKGGHIRMKERPRDQRIKVESCLPVCPLPGSRDDGSLLTPLDVSNHSPFINPLNSLRCLITLFFIFLSPSPLPAVNAFLFRQLLIHTRWLTHLLDVLYTVN